MKNEKFQENENILKILSMQFSVFMSIINPHYESFDLKNN